MEKFEKGPFCDFCSPKFVIFYRTWLNFQKPVNIVKKIEILKVSKNRKQFSSQNFLQKPNHRICFSILISSQDRKTNSLVPFLEEVLFGKFAFRNLLTWCYLMFTTLSHISPNQEPDTFKIRSNHKSIQQEMKIHILLSYLLWSIYLTSRIY